MMMMMMIIIILEKAPVVTAQNTILLTQNWFYFCSNDLSLKFIWHIYYINKRS